ncbi:MAG: glutamate-5-semialdehyde dehydrogenase [Deltaproteobacteria bacterium]|nr:glutamate-5-semialdehyde dehydrogenase [Deltaproteobacteria bacterium]
MGSTGMRQLALDAKNAANITAALSTKIKDELLLRVAEVLEKEQEALIAANRLDLEAARAKAMAPAMLDRLTLTPKRVAEMAQSLREVAALPDPVGAMERTWVRPNGLRVSRMRIPLGVIGIIYEARPNVTSDAAALCLKSGNAVILRGGSEALRSNTAIGALFQRELEALGIPAAALQVLPNADRQWVLEMLKMDDCIDLIIPRGGESLIRFVTENSTVPVLKHYKGVCHTFVDASADLEMAENLCINAKVQRPGVCNAMETLLVHRACADRFIPHMAAVFAAHGVELRGCPASCALSETIKPATEEDWDKEYLDLILAVRVVDNIEEAMEHIRLHGSDHTEVIVTNDYVNAQRFVREVNSSTVLVNASSRFADGHQLGLGAEIGISTTKLHAYGPMGLEDLTARKFVVYGNGQVRE